MEGVRPDDHELDAALRAATDGELTPFETHDLLGADDCRVLAAATAERRAQANAR